MTETSTVPASRIVIAIPTYRRAESLRRLLDAIAQAETEDDVHVLVADNEGEGQGFATVAGLGDGYRFPVAAIAVPEKGLANVRNAMIAHVRSLGDVDYIVMIDDDERPSPGWLRALLATQRQTDADVVGGPTVPVFVPGAPAWADTCPLFTCGDFADGPVDMIWGAGNSMLYRRVFDKVEGPLFDPVFNDWGGEDVDCFMRLRARGCRFAWSRNALVWEDIPASRTTLSWICRRAFRIGNSNMFAQLRWTYGEDSRWKALILSLAGLAYHSALLVAALPFPKRRVNNFCLLWRSAGKLAFLTGYRLREYTSSPH